MTRPSSSFNAVAVEIERLLAGHVWRRLDLTKQTLRLTAQDVGRQLRHTLLIGASLCPEDGNPAQVGVDCQINVCFPQLEADIANALNRHGAAGLSAVLAFSRMVPTDMLYGKTSFLIDAGDDVTIRRDSEQFVKLYWQYVEPVRLRLLSVQCLEDPGFYPHDSVFPLSWELRRAAYYHRTLPPSQFASYVDELRRRLDDYEKGLPDARTPDLLVSMASEAIAELRELVASLTSTRP